jgi:hypothetical protein
MSTLDENVGFCLLNQLLVFFSAARMHHKVEKHMKNKAKVRKSRVV